MSTKAASGYKGAIMTDTPEVYIIVEAGVVTAVHSTHDMSVVVIDMDEGDYDSETLEYAQSLKRAG